LLSDEFNDFDAYPVPYTRRFSRQVIRETSATEEAPLTHARDKHAPYSRSKPSRRERVLQQQLEATELLKEVQEDLSKELPETEFLAEQEEPKPILIDRPITPDTAPEPPRKRRKLSMLRPSQRGVREVLDHRRLPGNSADQTS